MIESMTQTGEAALPAKAERFSIRGLMGRIIVVGKRGRISWYRIAKRAFDIVFSILGLILLLPVFFLIAIAIKLDTEGSILFKQKRFGIHKSFFSLWKFRTMRQDAPADLASHLLEDGDKWITRTGSFLRSFSLDELPQLFNILKGDMSFVGPRPALWNQLDLMAARDRYGANHLPVGLTGWAQVNGRETLTIEEKAQLDGQYASRRSLLFDLRCLLKTFAAVGKGPEPND